jgi:hypothetical protein
MFQGISGVSGTHQGWEKSCLEQKSKLFFLRFSSSRLSFDNKQLSGNLSIGMAWDQAKHHIISTMVTLQGTEWTSIMVPAFKYSMCL